MAVSASALVHTSGCSTRSPSTSGTTGSDPVASGAAQLIYRGPDGDVYRLKGALPRAFLARGVLAVPNEPTALKMLVDERFEARKAAVVVGENTAATTLLPTSDFSWDESESTATIVKDRLNEVEIQVVTRRAAILVLNDSWHRGWKVFVNGTEQPVLKVNYDYRGVVVPSGNHRVVFLFRPAPLLIGLGISGVTMLLVLITFTWIGLHWLLRSRSGSESL